MMSDSGCRHSRGARPAACGLWVCWHSPLSRAELDLLALRAGAGILDSGVIEDSTRGRVVDEGGGLREEEEVWV